MKTSFNKTGRSQAPLVSEHRPPRAWVAIIILGMLCMRLGSTMLAAEDAVAILQKGLYEEEANQNLDAAMQAYQSVITLSEEQRKVAATAVFRLGECYRKKGLTNEAALQYQRLLRDYSDQTTLTRLSQQNLAGLGIALTNAMPSSAASQDILEDKAALEDKELSRLKQALRDSPDLINAQELGGLTPLHRAVDRKQLKVVRFLLESKANLNKTDNNGKTALYYAVTTPEMLNLLLSAQADPNAGTSKPLCNAVARGLRNAAEALLKAGADVNGREDYMTPMHYAAREGHISIAELLLEHGAQLNLKLKLKAEQPTPQPTPVAENARPGPGVYYAATPLHLAVCSKRPLMVRWLCEHKADINTLADSDQTPLSSAIESDQPEMVKILLEYGAVVDRKFSNTPSALYSAVSLGRNDIIPLLLPKAGDLNAPQFLHAPPQAEDYLLVCAVRNNLLEMIDLLITNKINVNIPNSYPLFYAVTTYKPRIVQRLLEAGAEVNVNMAISGWQKGEHTPLTYAVLNRSLDVAEMLLEHHADANRLSSTGDSPLHCAVRNIQPEMVALLLKSANPNVLDPEGESPLSLALNLLRTDRPNQIPVRLARSSGNPLVTPSTVNLSDTGRFGLDEIVKNLRQHGAKDELVRLSHITLQIKDYNNGNPIRIFRRDAKQLNHHTLLELASLVSTIQLNMPCNPDWRRITINRINPENLSQQILKISLQERATNSTEAIDVPLEWGDTVELNAATFIPTDSGDFDLHKVLTNCLTRKIIIETTQGKTEWLLCPHWSKPGPTRGVAWAGEFSLGDPSARATLPPLHFDRESGSGPVTGPQNIGGFWMKTTVYASGVLRDKSDVTHVKCRRSTGSTTSPLEVEYNLITAQFPDDLWLQNGDVITIPDKP